MRKGWFLKRLRELGVSLDRETRDRLYEVARKYDDVLRVEVGEKTVTIAVKRYNGGSPNRLTVRHRVERITVPLLEVKEDEDNGERAEQVPSCGILQFVESNGNIGVL